MFSEPKTALAQEIQPALALWSWYQAEFERAVTPISQPLSNSICLQRVGLLRISLTHEKMFPAALVLWESYSWLNDQFSDDVESPSIVRVWEDQCFPLCIFYFKTSEWL